MGRTLKKVPLDFNWPLKRRWPGYCFSFYADDVDEDICEKYAELLHDKCRVHPPEGPGFQLWETTSEGSPVSPVFETLEALCAWCAVNATTFGSFTATAEEWQKMLSPDGFVHTRQGNMLFL